jgi:hypothetical protein
MHTAPRSGRPTAQERQSRVPNRETPKIEIYLLTNWEKRERGHHDGKSKQSEISKPTIKA